MQQRGKIVNILLLDGSLKTYFQSSLSLLFKRVGRCSIITVRRQRVPMDLKLSHISSFPSRSRDCWHHHGLTRRFSNRFGNQQWCRVKKLSSSDYISTWATLQGRGLGSTWRVSIILVWRALIFTLLSSVSWNTMYWLRAEVLMSSKSYVGSNNFCVTCSATLFSLQYGECSISWFTGESYSSSSLSFRCRLKQANKALSVAGL